METTSDTNICRFTFSKQVAEMLHNFGKEYSELDRKAYLEMWDRWKQQNQEILTTESQNLKNKGYVGNFEDKIFKSARYYFRKKTDEKKPPKQRKKYISVDKDFLDVIDEHIKQQHTILKSPAKCYNNFNETKSNEIKEEYKRLKEDESMEEAESIEKIKKTYKNRYFQIHNLKTY
jgi:hypothetical protein